MAIRLAGPKSFRIEAVTVVATTHPEFPLLVIEFDHDAQGSGMVKGTRQSLARNAEDFIHNMILESLTSSRTPGSPSM